MNGNTSPLFAKADIPIRHDSVRQFRIRSVTGYTVEADDQVQFKNYFLEYDAAGNQLNQQKFNRDGKVIQEWKYDSTDKLVEEIVYEESGSVNYRYIYLYDERGHLSEKQMYLASNTIHYRVVLQYDATGRLDEEVYFDASGKHMHTDTFIYGDFDRLVRILIGQTGEWVFEYDEHGILTRKSGDLPSMSGLGETFEYQYDKQGLLVQIDHLHHSTMFVEYTFFD